MIIIISWWQETTLIQQILVLCCLSQNSKKMTKIAMILMIILSNIEKASECPSQTSNVDIHDLLKQKQLLNGGKQALSNQKVASLLPIHHQIQQEHRSVKEFIILVIVANTISTLLLIGIIQICRGRNEVHRKRYAWNRDTESKRRKQPIKIWVSKRWNAEQQQSW